MSLLLLLHVVTVVSRWCVQRVAGAGGVPGVGYRAQVVLPPCTTLPRVHLLLHQLEVYQLYRTEQRVVPEKNLLSKMPAPKPG